MSVPPMQPGVGGHVYDKYASRNPAERLVVERFLAAFRDLVRASGAASAVEVGAGEGYLAAEMADMGLAVRASDADPAIVEVARERHARGGVTYEAGDLFDIAPGSCAGADLLVCCEVLEHLAEPGRALGHLARAGAPKLLVSVPREPLWRLLNVARGRYWGALGNTPGHRNHWTRGGFLSFLRRQVEVVEVRQPVPWTMALCAVR